jgi:hypothetical protein
LTIENLAKIKIGSENTATGHEDWLLDRGTDHAAAGRRIP